MSDRVGQPVPVWLIVFCLTAGLLGAALRFVNLGDKPYWHDEVYTSLRVSGYTWKEVDRALDQGPLPAPEVQQFQRPGPAHGMGGTLRGLAVGEPQHPPLYFALARLWVQAVGDGVATRRLLSALFSLLALPAVFWLCRELFGGRRVGWVAVALVAVSPLHLVFAQEARASTLWILGILLSSAALLRALRRGTWRAWALYATCVALALYTFLFSVFVLLAHGTYVRWGEREDRTRWRKWLRAAGAACLVAAPWYALVLWHNGKVRATTAWTLDNTSPARFALTWLTNLSRPFLDFNEQEHVARLSVQHGVVYGLVGLLLAAAFYRLIRTVPRRNWLFLLCLIGTTAVPLVLADLVLIGRLSIIPRYQFPTWLGLELVLAWWIASEVTDGAGAWRRAGSIAGLVFLVLAGAASSIAFARAPTWWHKGGVSLQEKIAPLINRVPSSLVVMHESYDILSISYRLRPDVRLRRVGDVETFRLPRDGAAIWLYRPSSELEQRLSETYRLTSVRGVHDLWRLGAQTIEQ